MMINPVDPFNKLNKIGKVGGPAKEQGVQKPSKGGEKGSDSINISDQAKELLESKKVIDIIKNEPDVRLEKVNQIKKLIADGKFDHVYLTDEVLDKVADRITDSFLG